MQQICLKFCLELYIYILIIKFSHSSVDVRLSNHPIPELRFYGTLVPIAKKAQERGVVFPSPTPQINIFYYPLVLLVIYLRYLFLFCNNPFDAYPPFPL